MFSGEKQTEKMGVDCSGEKEIPFLESRTKKGAENLGRQPLFSSLPERKPRILSIVYKDSVNSYMRIEDNCA